MIIIPILKMRKRRQGREEGEAHKPKSIPPQFSILGASPAWLREAQRGKVTCSGTRGGKRQNEDSRPGVFVHNTIASKTDGGGGRLADGLTWEGGVRHEDVTWRGQTRHSIWLVTGAWLVQERGSICLRVASRGPVLGGSGDHLKPPVSLICKKREQTGLVTEPRPELLLRVACRHPRPPTPSTAGLRCRANASRKLK